MRVPTVLISGASIAGPTLAYWLARHGAAVTVIEQATGPRPGGQGVDFRGYWAATFTVPNLLGLDHAGVMYNEPGRAVQMSSGRAPDVADVLMIFTGPPPGDRLSPAQVVERITDRYADAGWVVPQLLAALPANADPYLAPLEQIDLPRWSSGRIGLVGDAAWCAGPGGAGTGLAMMGAYILAHLVGTELGADPAADPTVAFDRYQRDLTTAAATGMRQAKWAGRFLAPATAGAIRRRNRTLSVLSHPAMARLLTRMASGAANAITLDAYPREPELATRP